ncbi:uncharacterized protein RBU33_012105 isoform 1-T1 [Hipposideros larvatus]
MGNEDIRTYSTENQNPFVEHDTWRSWERIWYLVPSWRTYLKLVPGHASLPSWHVAESGNYEAANLPTLDFAFANWNCLHIQGLPTWAPSTRNEMWQHQASIQTFMAAVNRSSCPMDTAWPLQVPTVPAALCPRLNATYLAPPANT